MIVVYLKVSSGRLFALLGLFTQLTYGSSKLNIALVKLLFICLFAPP